MRVKGTFLPAQVPAPVVRSAPMRPPANGKEKEEKKHKPIRGQTPTFHPLLLWAVLSNSVKSQAIEHHIVHEQLTLRD